MVINKERILDATNRKCLFLCALKVKHVLKKVRNIFFKLVPVITQSTHQRSSVSPTKGEAP
jgi:hypothetical protein